MMCDDIAKLIPLYYYGELTPQEEEQVEEHTHACAACTAVMEQQRLLAAALERRVTEAPAFLLEDCRADLMAAVHGGAPRAARSHVSKGPWALFLEALAHSFGNLNRLRQPIGAVALIAIGFFGARLTNLRTVPGVVTEGLDEPYHTVRSVQSDPEHAGAVVITFDETRRRQKAGRMDDPDIRQLLVAAAHEDNPAVRVESVDLLKGQSRSLDVRDALLNAAQDPNDGVRLKAMEGLRTMSFDPDVRRVLAQVLRADANTAVKIQAIDLLSAHRDDSVVGLMQSLVQREQNGSVRLKLEKALREMNASVGTF